MKKTSMRDAFTRFAILVGKVPVFKRVFRKPYDRIKARREEISLANFQKHGFEALTEFNKCMNSHGIPYSLAFGTLLGAIREHDFISHDDDLDFAMWIDDYKPEIVEYLNEVGIHLVHSFSVNNDKLGKEDTFEYKGVLIDIFYFYRIPDQPVYCCDFINWPGCISRIDSVNKHGGLLPRKILVPLCSDTTRIIFKGVEVSIPTNYQQILSFRYGNDYMTPKPRWRPNTEYISEMVEWLGIYKEY